MAKFLYTHRRGTTSDWANLGNEIVPLRGELVVELDEINNLHKLKIGDGVHPYSQLAYLQAGDEVVTQALAKALPRVIAIALTTNWTQDADNKYSQVIALDNITAHSRLDLQPNADMIAEFKQLGLVFVTENNGGVITVYSVGNMPTKEYTMQATIVETECDGEDELVVGIPIGTPKIPTTLPNPYVLTFTGAATGTYDGSEAATINIPEVAGADGKSAYEIALDNGFEGTEEEWLESLKGADGTSVTVESIEVSPEDGGENVVTFSDGNTLTVLNGTKGRQGTSVTVSSVGKSLDDGGENTVKFSDGTILTVRNGNKGTDGKDGISATHSWDGTTLTITSASGTSSADLKGANGKDGANGTNGKDGVSATHSWNGTTLTVTSASGTSSADLKGSDGKTAYTYAREGGYAGTETEFASDLSNTRDSVLYTVQTLTEAQKAQARANIGATAGEDVEFAGSLEWLRENGDTSKKYVLPDGYIYAWLYKEETGEHNANDGTGWINYRPQSTWGNTKGAASGVWTSPIIYIDPTSCAPTSDRLSESEVVISGLEKIVPAFNSSSIWVFYYKADGSQYAAKKGSQLQSVGKDTEISLPLGFYLKDTGTFADSNWATIQGVRICIGVSTSGDITEADVENLKVNMPFYNTTVEGYDWYSTGQQYSNDKATQQNSADIAALKEEVAALKEATSKSPTNSGAKWFAIGDSITYGLYSSSATAYHQPVVGQRWVDYVAKYNGYELTNLGKSNAGFLTSPTFRSMVDGADFANADLVTIMLGVNDWKYEGAVDKVGTMDDDISTGGTIVSELRYGLEKIISDNPYCKIILITPINAKIGSRGTEATNWAYGYNGTITPCGSLKNFGDKLKEVCEYYGIQVVDMTNSSIVNRKSITTVLPDGIHPNLECYEVLGKELARRITFA